MAAGVVNAGLEVATDVARMGRSAAAAATMATANADELLLYDDL